MRQVLSLTFALVAALIVGNTITGCEPTVERLDPQMSAEEQKELALQKPLDQGNWTFEQTGKVLVSFDKATGKTAIYAVVPGLVCNQVAGCRLQSISDMDVDEFAQVTAALELDDIDLSQDCAGNCGPLGIKDCAVPGDGLTFAGKAYLDQWWCVPVIDEVTGACKMVAAALPCDDVLPNSLCEKTGKYPSYSTCEIPPACDIDLDCDDANLCTVDSCKNGQCINPLVEGLACNDSNACTTNDKCVAGVCKGSGLVCNDNNVCTTDSCALIGGCKYMPVGNADKVGCTDGDVCTTNDVCVDGSCAGAPLDCTDGKTCTTDSCVLGVGCVAKNVPNDTLCVDGNLCTVSDLCQNGVCVGKPKGCSDANPCTADSCNQENGQCVYDPSKDGTVCGTKKSCVAATCYDDDEVCEVKNQKLCMQTNGVLGHYLCVFGDGAILGVWQLQEACGKVVEKTTKCFNDTGCVGDGAEAACADEIDNDLDGKTDCADTDCKGKPPCGCQVVADCDDGNVCTTDVCEAESGSCSHLPIANCPPPVCTPNCANKQCGSDGCGGTCGTCAADKMCNLLGQCVDKPQCAEDAGCGVNEVCFEGKCILVLPGQCKPFAVSIEGKDATTKAYLVWYNNKGSKVEFGTVDNGTQQSDAGQCSVIATDFAPGKCSCKALDGDNKTIVGPCGELPDSPGEFGCWHNMFSGG